MFFRSFRVVFIFSLILLSCSEKNNDIDPNVQKIVDQSLQDSLFNQLSYLTFNSIPASFRNDSLSFLILPIEAACPSCRKKTIDSILKYQSSLRSNQFIIISGTGMDAIKSYFNEQNTAMPVAYQGIFYDTTNQAFIKDLIFTKPTIYNSSAAKVYEKISCVPTNIKKHLKAFFTNNTASHPNAKH